MKNNYPQIEKLSPSKINFIESCKLRYYNTLIQKPKAIEKKAFNKFSFLGTVIHNVIESYVNNNCIIDDFEQVWNDELEKV
ncbi:PD-(D/E)XK nuclease family protein [Aureispira anguillae]|uniref:PD-(D/E)XK nuclease family protein n=1 Tax=Aureispira anguillae TaxID=2864201 RepID=A0A915VK89_9BACT|nr:PD-(D/E)XK nuclease family protein [Aureispira anguillae]BDS09567.1 PD-(D/E)XK nuclease family protein [Aureispira anguillae]